MKEKEQTMNDQISNEFQVLYDTVLDRKANPEEGSYTSYLFGKGKEKILKKVGEESTEVVIAAMKDNKEELIGELGDLFYHVMVLIAQQNVTLEEVEAELARRSGKTHNLKPERKPVTQY